MQIGVDDGRLIVFRPGISELAIQAFPIELGREPIDRKLVACDGEVAVRIQRAGLRADGNRFVRRATRSASRHPPTATRPVR